MCASAESNTSEAVEKTTEEYRIWVRSLFLDLADAAGVPEPKALAKQLVLVYDGAGRSGARRCARRA
jgi:hypothetical protein